MRSYRSKSDIKKLLAVADTLSTDILSMDTPLPLSQILLVVDYLKTLTGLQSMSSIRESNIIIWNKFTLVDSLITHAEKNPLITVYDALKLAFIYFREGEHVKVAGFLNFAINILKALNNSRMKIIILNLEELCFLNLKTFLYASSNKLHLDEYEHISERKSSLPNYQLENKNTFNNIRQNILVDYKTSKMKDINQLYFNMHLEIKNFCIKIIEQTIYQLRVKPPRFSFVLLGSNAAYTATPFSDIEFFIITEDDGVSTINYFKEFTKLFLINIINIGETPITYLGIELNNGRKIIKLDLVDDHYTKKGFRCDPNWPTFLGCKTPLGKKIDGKVIYRLMGSPTALVDLVAKNRAHHDIFLRQSLMLSNFIYGDINLYDKFRKLLFKAIQLEYASYLSALFGYDFLKIQQVKNTTLSLVNHKNYFYRPIFALIDTLYYQFLPTCSVPFHKKLNLLYNYGIINQDQWKLLNLACSISLYLRFRQHFKFNKDKIYITPDDREHLLVKFVQHVSINIYSSFNTKKTKAQSDLLLLEADLFNKYACNTFFRHKNEIQTIKKSSNHYLKAKL